MSIQYLLEKCLREREEKTPRGFVRERERREGRGKRLAVHPKEIFRKRVERQEEITPSLISI